MTVIPVVLSAIVSMLTKFILRFFIFNKSCDEARHLRCRSSRCCCCMGTIPGTSITASREDVGGVGTRPMGRRGGRSGIISFDSSMFPRGARVRAMGVPSVISRGAMDRGPRKLSGVSFRGRLRRSLGSLWAKAVKVTRRREEELVRGILAIIIKCLKGVSLPKLNIVSVVRVKLVSFFMCRFVT